MKEATNKTPDTRSPLEVFLYEHRITFTELAEEASLSRQTVYHAIRGSCGQETRESVSAALQRLCVRLGIEFSDPWGRDE